MGFRVVGPSGHEIEVNSDGEALVALNQDCDLAGHACAAGESNPAGVGVGRMVRPIEVSPDYRTRVGLDSPLFKDNFSHVQYNVSKYKGVNTTATHVLSGGRMVLNSGNSVTASQGAQLSTWAHFRLGLSETLYLDIEAQVAQLLQTNNVVEFGWMICTGVAAPTDGAFFRFNASGAALGVVNIAGAETTVQLKASPGVNWVPAAVTMYHFLVAVHNDAAEFWIDDVLVGRISTPAAVGAPSQAMSAPLCARLYNSGTVTTAQRLEIANWSVTAGDSNSNRLWPTTMAVMGNSAVNAPDGTAAGQTANYANTAAPVSATLSNTAAGYTTLGGQWQFAAVAGAETDYALFGYLNPAGTNAIPGKNLVVRGIRIDAFNMGAAVATTATVLQWGLGVGSSGVSLVTADSATAGTRAPRRITIGAQAFQVGAAIGSMATPVDINLDAPVVVEPGTYLHVILKMPVGTATASQIVRGTCFVNAYFE